MLDKWETVSLLQLLFARRCSRTPPWQMLEPKTSERRCLSAAQKAPKPWARKRLSNSPHFIFYLKVNVLAFAQSFSSISFHAGQRKPRPQWLHLECLIGHWICFTEIPVRTLPFPCSIHRTDQGNNRVIQDQPWHKTTKHTSLQETCFLTMACSPYQQRI